MSSSIPWNKEMRLALHCLRSCYIMSGEQQIQLLNNMFSDRLEAHDFANGISENDKRLLKRQYRSRNEMKRSKNWEGIVGTRNRYQEEGFQEMLARVADVAAELGLPGRATNEDRSAYDPPSADNADSQEKPAERKRKAAEPAGRSPREMSQARVTADQLAGDDEMVSEEKGDTETPDNKPVAQQDFQTGDGCKDKIEERSARKLAPASTVGKGRVNRERKTATNA